MKIIDLLNKIANGEEVPKKIKYDTLNYYFRDYDYKEYDIEKDYIDEQTSFIEKIDFYKLHDEVEIIEEDKKIEKLYVRERANDFLIGKSEHVCYGTESYVNKIIADKINEIIGVINKGD